jgi:hypothetical protein
MGVTIFEDLVLHERCLRWLFLSSSASAQPEFYQDLRAPRLYPKSSNLPRCIKIGQAVLQKSRETFLNFY